jgi:hypothetical protein
MSKELIEDLKAAKRKATELRGTIRSLDGRNDDSSFDARQDAKKKLQKLEDYIKIAENALDTLGIKHE